MLTALAIILLTKFLIWTLPFELPNAGVRWELGVGFTWFAHGFRRRP